MDVSQKMDKVDGVLKVNVSDDKEDDFTSLELKCIEEVVKTILILDHSKKPFKHADIASFLSQKPSRKRWNVILDRAKQKLKELGLTLVEVKNPNSKTFILVSNSEPIPSMYRYAPEKEVADRTLLILVLSFIFMKEKPVTNDELFAHLKQLNIYNENKSTHRYFGDVKKKILSDFVSQMYLEKIQIDRGEETFELKWGERAHAEVSKMSILKFVCEVAYEGTVQPESLGSHYEKAMAEEEVENEQSNDDIHVENE